MESLLDTQSLSTATSSSTPHTPSPSMNEPTGPVEYSSFDQTTSGPYYLDYQSQSQHQHQHHQAHQQQPPMLSIEISHPSTTAGPLYRRASFPFVQHDHSMSEYPKYANNEQQLDQEPHLSAHHRYDYEDQQDLDHSSAMVVPTQVPQGAHQQHPHLFYRPSSSSSSVSSVSAPPSGFLNPAMSSIPVMHTDDAASKETQYLRRKCFNCGTTEPPSWRRSTLNPGKIVCNKCGLYERTHNKPRPHQFGLRPGNKTRKQPQSQSQPQQPNGRLSGLSSPSSSPKRHGMSVKKEQLDYSQAMRRGSIASINSGSGASDWDDHSGYSTASSAYHSSLGMAPPYGQQPQQHALGHHHHPHHGHSSHVPNHHGHHPYNSAYSMPPPRSTSHGIRLPQAPPMKVPATGNKAGSASPITGPGVNVISGGGNSSHSNLPHIHTSTNASSTGNVRHSSSPDNMSMLSPSALGAGVLGSPYGTPGVPSSSNSSMPSSSSSMYSPSLLRGGGGPPPLAPPSADYYARRGSTSQIPHHHHASSLYHEDLSTMRRGSVGAIGMGGPMSYGGMSQQQRGLPPPSSWHPHYNQSAGGIPLSEMSMTPTPATNGGGSGSADSTPQQGYANVHSATGTDLTPSPPHHQMSNSMLRGGSGPGSDGASPIGANIQPEVPSLAV